MERTPEYLAMRDAVLGACLAGDGGYNGAMPYFHATFRKHLPSIMKHGLGGRVVEQNWDGCDPGVYLAALPELCVLVMVDHYAQHGDPSRAPREHLAEIVVIVIDDSRVQTARLGPDPSIGRKDVWLYDGVIDVTNMPVIDIDTIVPG